MTAGRWIICVGAALLVGTLAGRVLFSPRSQAPGKEPVLSAPTRVSALPKPGARANSPDSVFASLLEQRSSAVPARSRLAMLTRLKAMGDREVQALVDDIVAGDFKLMQGEFYLLEALWVRYSLIDPSAAYHDSLKLSWPLSHFARGAAMAAWGRRAPEEVIAFLKEVEKDRVNLRIERFQAAEEAFAALVEIDPERAIRLMDADRDAVWSKHARGAVFDRWMLDDKESAVSWMFAQIGTDRVSDNNMIREMEAAPQAVLAALHRVEPNRYSRNSLESTMHAWMGRDREAAIEGLQNIPLRWHSDSLARRVGGAADCTEWSENDINAAVAALPKQSQRESFWSGIFDRSAHDHRFGEAAALLDRVPEGRRAGVAAELVSRWAAASPGEASAWLAQQAPGDVLDHAISGFATRVARLEPESARRWAESIADPEFRAEVLGSL